ncbi:cytochrome P450 [Pseudomonas putida]|uniref:cytochrome P450 n=1 Tax=Pseudomonas putida TaxID=303 RepID=UPI00383B036A
MNDLLVSAQLPVVSWASDGDLGEGEALLATLDACRLESWGARSIRGFEIFRYAEASSILRSRDFASPFGKLSENSGLTPEDGWIYHHMGSTLANVQGPAHVKLKSIFLEFFGPRAIGRWRSHVRDIVRSRVKTSAKDGALDLARDVCLVLPAYLFCRMIARPDEDAAFLAHTSDEILTIFDQDPKNRDRIIKAGNRLKTYTENLIAERTLSRGDDLISYLIGKREEGALSHDELVNNVAMLLEASVDNTGNQFALTMHHLLSVPERWQHIKDNPGLIKKAIDESIRITPKVTTINRIANIDTVVNGVSIPAGSWISVSILGAQRDTTGLPEAARYNLDRVSERPHLVFGGGVYMCLGMLLSLLELEEGIATLAEEFPDLALIAPLEQTFTARNITVQSLKVKI